MLVLRKKTQQNEWEEVNENVFQIFTTGVVHKLHLSIKVSESLDFDFSQLKDEAREEEGGRKSNLEKMVSEEHRKSVQAMRGTEEEEKRK